MEEIGDGGMDLRDDLMKKLDDDTAIHVLHYLDTTRDIANASGVCRSWRRFGPLFFFLVLAMLLLMRSAFLNLFSYVFLS